jgi:hypothetical protein
MTARIIITSILVTLYLAAGALAQTPERKPSFRSEGDNPVTAKTGPVRVESAEGDFSALFPSGCSETNERILEPDPTGNFQGFLILTAGIYCDRWGEEGEGCSVFAYVDDDPDTGQPADSAFVLARVTEVLSGYGVEILVQKPYRKKTEDGPLMEGVDVLAADSERKGQVWVRGLLVEGDVYVLAAWRTEGPLAVDPEFVAFFESFIAHGA